MSIYPGYILDAAVDLERRVCETNPLDNYKKLRLGDGVDFFYKVNTLIAAAGEKSGISLNPLEIGDDMPQAMRKINAAALAVPLPQESI